ncbi:MAG: hypothetical protein LBJ69_01725 [Holosporales bacterium]|jgi:F0F1-type ATP synthase membrane subunit b/b'|nr:hypothetical protein [Holosporales bacterium]
MLPQLNSSFYVSQLFWLFVCLSVLVVFLRRRVIPRLNSALAERDTFVSKEEHDINAIETDITGLETEIESMKETEIKNTTEIIRKAVRKTEITMDEQLRIMKEEHDEIISKTRKRANDEFRNLGSAFKIQIDITAQIVFERLISGRS